MRTIFRKSLLGLLGVFMVMLAVLAINTMRYRADIRTDVAAYSLGADIGQATELLSRAIQFETDSTKPDAADFSAFTDFLQQAFPGVFAAVDLEMMAANTPLLRWQGTDPDLAPVLLAAHYDVVPIAPGSLDRWDHPPFAGVVADGYIWGRGTLDNKGALIAMLSAAEHLIQEGFTPKRSVYFSFGGDEEVGGDGARSVAKHLNQQGVQLAWTLDEGSFVLDNVIPGLDVPVASINLSEKGFLTVKLVAEAEGGHSALPPKMTAVGRIARAVDRVQNSPLEGGLDGVTAEFFDALGRHFTLDKRALFANQWLFSPLLETGLSNAASTNAMLRTTTAPTMLSGSNKANVLPTEATATINFRLHPRDTAEHVIAHIAKVIDDPEIDIVFDPAAVREASPVASSSAQGFEDIESSILSVFGEIASVPGLTIAATDARHYAQASDNAYRINPFLVEDDDIARFHGTNERLSVANLERGINFFGALITRQ
ncbi:MULTISPECIES: M20 family peptidase [unclassified Phaeobacter]|uniref:M20 family peptidase n=1 Tax=unclassified Phaeobacter TaxID=2621772 RepID=UPI003A861054